MLRSIAHARGVVISASPLGKFKMVSQVVAILLLILGDEHLQGAAFLGRLALWVADGGSSRRGLLAAVDYYRRRSSHVLPGDVGRTVTLSPFFSGSFAPRISSQPASSRLPVSRYSLVFEFLEQPIVVGKRLRRALDPFERFAQIEVHRVATRETGVALDRCP